MKSKNNKILVGCLSLLLVLSVGYALFSETVTINGTATAKGDFDIDVTCQTGVANVAGLSDYASMGMKGPSIESGYSGDSCTVVDNKVSFNTSLNAPGSARYFTIKATNNGTIDALAPMFSSGTKEACVSQEMKNQAGFGGKTSCHRFLFDTSYYVFSNGPDTRQYDFEDFSTAYILEKPDGTLINLLALPEEEAFAYVDGESEKLKMPAGYTIYYIGKFFVPEDYQFHDRVNMIDLSLKADYSLNFVQQTN